MALSLAIEAPLHSAPLPHTEGDNLFVNVPIKNARMERSTWKSGEVRKEHKLGNVIRAGQHNETTRKKLFRSKYQWVMYV